MGRKEIFVKTPTNYKTANRNCAMVKETEQKDTRVERTAEDKTELGYFNKIIIQYENTENDLGKM